MQVLSQLDLAVWSSRSTALAVGCVGGGGDRYPIGHRCYFFFQQGLVSTFRHKFKSRLRKISASHNWPIITKGTLDQEYVRLRCLIWESGVANVACLCGLIDCVVRGVRRGMAVLCV
jgi:hypothetical protein